MRNFEIVTRVAEYATESELPELSRNLLAEARKAAEKAYAPYSEFHVGAALLLENGTVVTGNNQENAAYPSGLCAERVAVFAAGAQFPDIPAQAIAISCKTPHFSIDTPLSPCGACRQVLAEYESRHKQPTLKKKK
ncbi:MAG: cdd [Bacteroidetes bacterium]|nr:MAG: cdd [Bacteroidota bacterium]